MSEVMIKCNNEMTLSNRNYQQSFFDYEYEKLNCEDDIIKVLHKESENKQEIDCKDLCMLLYAHCGPKYLHKDIREALLKLETNEIVIIDRQRKLTPTGKTSKALDFIKDKISIKFNFENTQESFL